MKTLYLIGGTMGVGKTTVSQCLKLRLDHSVFLDGDWCWDAHPFIVTEETKKLVLDNICYMLNNFIHCSAYENIIFCWVMHQQDIIDAVLEKLDVKNCRVKSVSLVCDENTLCRRLEKDIEKGIRSKDILYKSKERMHLYWDLNTIKIETDFKNPDSIAEEIAELS